MKSEVFTLPNGSDITLTSYLLDSSKEMPNMETRPAVLVLPGGGYHGCSDREAEPVAMAFLAQGYHAFVLRYSVGKGKAAFPRPLEDAEAALELIKTRADEWKVKKDKIAVIGFSAGGHLAAALATMGRVRPNAVILGYPCILSSISSILAEPVPSVDEYVDGKTPPAFIFGSYEDTVVPIENSLAFANALDKAKVPFELHVFQKGHHGFSLANVVVSPEEKYLQENRFARAWLELCIKWLNELFEFH
ncbi:MAG TPA: alpha/beta hydrolase [Clostridiales bacterium]|jgi:acetyl esterase/lipase|nr:alpha/beta hydrolase [Clostridiales bacterium]HRT82334.1 alpha/beta hydrolase [Oscillospiraceae bacterium]